MSAVADFLIERCGLSRVFARSAILLAIQRAGLDPTSLMHGDWPRLRPEVERTVRRFLGERADEVLHSLDRDFGSTAPS